MKMKMKKMMIIDDDDNDDDDDDDDGFFLDDGLSHHSKTAHVLSYPLGTADRRR